MLRVHWALVDSAISNGIRLFLHYIFRSRSQTVRLQNNIVNCSSQSISSNSHIACHFCHVQIGTCCCHVLVCSTWLSWCATRGEESLPFMCRCTRATRVVQSLQTPPQSGQLTAEKGGMMAVCKTRFRSHCCVSDRHEYREGVGIGGRRGRRKGRGRWVQFFSLVGPLLNEWITFEESAEFIKFTSSETKFDKTSKAKFDKFWQ